MLAEIYYWRDMSRVLDAVAEELKSQFVDQTVDVLKPQFEVDVQKFMQQRDRVVKGAKEACWNTKYLKILQNPVQVVETVTDLKPIQLQIAPLLKTLKNIYDSSNFYKEARIVSFIDRLLACVTSKIKQHCGMGLALLSGVHGTHVDMLAQVDSARSICKKFVENFFVKDLMVTEQDKVLQESGHLNQSNSYYSKEGLDYLYFQRPGTAYAGDSSKQQMGTNTKTNFFDPSKPKPIELVQSKNKSLVFQIWFARAEKILNHLQHTMQILDFIESCTVIASRFSEFMKQQILQQRTYEMKSFVERYQTVQPQFDMWALDKQFEARDFIEKFEAEALRIEKRFQNFEATGGESKFKLSH